MLKLCLLTLKRSLKEFYFAVLDEPKPGTGEQFRCLGKLNSHDYLFVLRFMLQLRLFEVRMGVVS